METYVIKTGRRCGKTLEFNRMVANQLAKLLKVKPPSDYFTPIDLKHIPTDMLIMPYPHKKVSITVEELKIAFTSPEELEDFMDELYKKIEDVSVERVNKVELVLRKEYKE